MIILDASGSMWGAVRGETKIEIARKSVRDLLVAWPAERKLGLMAYGHRRKGDCDDIEIISPIGTIDAPTLADKVDALNPKGKTPIAESLRQAATALKSNEARSTIILVSDGIETCSGDPCAVAREFEASGVDFTAHVIGFDVADPAAKAQLKCIADVSGGIYRDADDAAGLAAALDDAAIAQGGAPQPPAVPATDTTYNLRGVARLSKESDPLGGYGSSVTWRILKAADRIEEYSSAKTALYHTVPAGDWIVEVTYGQAKAEAPVTIETGKIASVDIDLNAGLLAATLTQPGADPAASPDLTWQIFTASDTATYLVISYDDTIGYVLPAGDYQLKVVRDGLATATQPVTIVAGETLNLNVILKAGTLRYSAVGAFTAQIRTPGEEGANIANLDETGEKAMNPGNYVLRARYEGGAEKDTNFTIVEGQTVEVSVTP